MNYLFFSYDHDYVKMLSDRFVERITSELTHVQRNGDPERGYAGCVNLSFAYVEGESLLMALKDIALSSGIHSYFPCCNLINTHKVYLGCI